MPTTLQLNSRKLVVHCGVHQEDDGVTVTINLSLGVRDSSVRFCKELDIPEQTVDEPDKETQTPSDQRNARVHDLLPVEQLCCALAGADAVHVDNVITQCGMAPWNSKRSSVHRSI